MSQPKYIVRLTDGKARPTGGSEPHGEASCVGDTSHARILLKAEAGTGGSGWVDERIAEAVDCGASTAYRGRQAFVERGFEAALARKCRPAHRATAS